jgi:hypothetical protein
MGEGLLSILKAIPDVAKAVAADMPFFHTFLKTQKRG